MALKIGDKVPHFSVIDNNGNVFESNTIVGKKAVIFYFYPKDNTYGCTQQACSFRDNFEKFKNLNAEIIGISSDDVASHKKFINQYQLPFLLLSDTDKKIRKLFGVKPDLFGLIDGRSTYIVDKEGIIRFIFDSMNTKNHISKALEVLKNK